METIDISKTKFIDNNITNLNDFLTVVKQGHIFKIKEKYNPTETPDNMIERFALKENVSLAYTTLQNKAVVLKDNIAEKHYFMSQEFFNKYKNIITEVTQQNYLNKDYINIDKIYFSDSLLDKLLNNNFKKLTLNDIKLTEEQLFKIKNSNKLIDLKINNETINLSKEPYILNHTFEDLKTSKHIYFPFRQTDLLDEELENIKFINEEAELKLYNINTTVALKKVSLSKEIEKEPYDTFDKSFDHLKNGEHKYFDNIIKIVNKLKQYNKTNKIAFEIEDKVSFNEYVLPHIKDYKNIKISHIKDNLKNDFDTDNPDTLFDIDKYIEMETTLDKLALPIKNSSLSPLEKYLKVYDIVKNFKEYKESDDKAESRSIKYILNNEYMVCVGYANLLSDLLSRVGIESLKYSVDVDISYDNGFTVEEKVVELEGHAKTIVNIVDPKYNINGYYIADATWDNNLSKDLYNNALRPMNLMTKQNRMNKLVPIDLLLDVLSIEDYNMKLNVLLNKTINVSESEIFAYKTVVTLLMNTLSSIDSNLFNALFPLYEKLTTSTDKEDYLFLFNVAGEQIVKKANKEIPLETLFGAVSNIKEIDTNLYMQKFNEIENLSIMEDNIGKTL